jgi:hypothetical protein
VCVCVCVYIYVCVWRWCVCLTAFTPHYSLQIEEAIDAIAARLVPSDVQYAQVHFLRYLNAVHHKVVCE